MNMYTMLVTCEHATNAVPQELTEEFTGAETVLASHRGWDPGAEIVAQAWAERWNAPYFATTVSRLVCDVNRSLRHPSLWSEYTRALPDSEKQALLARYYLPHRNAVEAEVARLIARGNNVLHLAAHSFTPVLHGETRGVDIGLLYDPARPGERRLGELWAEALRQAAPRLRVRRNAPYRGVADGLPTSLRRRFSPERHPELHSKRGLCPPHYLGFEIEYNQALLEHGPFPADLLGNTLADTLEHVVMFPE